MPDDNHTQVLTGEDILATIKRIEQGIEFHESEVARLRKVLADINDAVAGRARKPRSGRFARKPREKKASGAAGAPEVPTT